MIFNYCKGFLECLLENEIEKILYNSGHFSVSEKFMVNGENIKKEMMINLHYHNIKELITAIF